MKSLILKDHEVRALIDHGEVLVVRALKKQPEEEYSKAQWYPDRYNKTEQWCFWGRRDSPVHNKCGLPLFTCPLGQVGERRRVGTGRVIVENISIECRQVQTITEKEACKCGCVEPLVEKGPLTKYKRTVRCGFSLFWDSDNKKNNWESNPWCWFVLVRRVEG